MLYKYRFKLIYIRNPNFYHFIMINELTITNILLLLLPTTITAAFTTILKFW